MYSRTKPFFSRIKERYLLTGAGSTKKTYHLSLDISGSGISFKVGDSIGVLPTNDPKSVDQILEKIQAAGSEIVTDMRANTQCTVREFLLNKANLARVNTTFFKLLCEKGKPSELLSEERKSELTKYLDTYNLLELLHLHQPADYTPQEFCKNLMPLMPRFYSIASSQKIFPNEIHLTVAYVSYIANGHLRYGVGSHFLCDTAIVDETAVPLYVQPSNHFTLPADPNTSIILIGPGTGVAPYRAFLQERIAMGSTGRNWLFFGERNRATDFYYSDYWLQLEKEGRLRLDAAFSRDQTEKIYVQHKLLEQKKSLWNWIENNSSIYVCGDAQEMAKDVETTLLQIIRDEGKLSEEDARGYLKTLRLQKRYLQDVY